MDRQEQDNLLCDEQLVLDSPTQQITPSFLVSNTSNVVVSSNGGLSDDERETAIRVLLQRQPSYLPSLAYVGALLSSDRVVRLRCNAIRWIVMACLQLNLSFATLFSSINYLDRFVSIFIEKKWETWMMELMSIACVSIAAKFEEITPIPLHSFPMEELNHYYDTNTIQRMELLVLNALKWKLHCVTPHSYLDLILCCVTNTNMTALLSSQISDLLLASQLDAQFLVYHPLSLAISCIKCALHQTSSRSNNVELDLTKLTDHLIPKLVKDELEKCCGMMMEKLNQNPPFASVAKLPFPALPSPVTVIKQTVAVRCLDLDIFLKSEDELGPKLKKQRR